MALLLASDGGVYVREKLLPCVGMLYVVFGAVFALLVGIAVQSMYVIVADHVGRVKMIFATQPGDQADHRAVGCIVVLTCGIGMADLNGDGLKVHGIVGVGNLVRGDTLDHLTLQTNDKVAAGAVNVGGGIVKVVPIRGGRGARVCGIVYDDVFYVRSRHIDAGTRVGIGQ